MPNRVAFHFVVALLAIAMIGISAVAAQSAPEAAVNSPTSMPADSIDRDGSTDRGLEHALMRLWQTIRSLPRIVEVATADVPTPREALECDGKSRVHSVRNEWAYLSGFDTAVAALQNVLDEGFVIPRTGYEELSRGGDSVLYGFRNRNKVKVAIRIDATESGRWIPEWLADCHLAEYGPKADMGPGVWLWANRNGKTIQERRGPAHCRQQSVRTLWWATSSGKRRDQRFYVRDPEGRFRNQWRAPYLRFTKLPSDARNTGYRRDGATIWMAPDRDSIYIKDGRNVQRWPRVPNIAGCA